MVNEKIKRMKEESAFLIGLYKEVKNYEFTYGWNIKSSILERIEREYNCMANDMSREIGKQALEENEIPYELK